MRRARPGFTLIEMLIAVAVAAVLLALAAPSFREYILLQRLKSINAQVVTDLAFARSEAVSRGVPVRVRVMPWTSAAGMSCYVIFAVDESGPLTPTQKFMRCNCRQPPGSVCAAGAEEIRTVQVPDALKVYVAPNNAFASSGFSFDPRNGGMTAMNVDGAVVPLTQFNIEAFIDTARKFVDQVNVSGRTSVCIPAGSKMQGTTC